MCGDGDSPRAAARNRDGKFPALFDAVLADAGIEVVLTGVRMPRMHSVMERWVKTCRRELPDRTLIWNQSHLQRWRESPKVPLHVCALGMDSVGSARLVIRVTRAV
jgi:hypothetical protein